ncbi:MAG: SelL-related redox protein [Planctomyces sp.]|jgi:peroxiredoxin
MSTASLESVIGKAAPDLILPDQNGKSIRLSDLWKQCPLTLIFARHLGCPFCREHLMEVQRDIDHYRAAGMAVAAVTMSPPSDTLEFRNHFQLAFTMLSDIDQEAYRAYGVRRGSLNTVAGPALWWKGLKSFVSFGGGKPAGDPYQLPGSFVIDVDGVFRFAHYAVDSADWAKTVDHLSVVSSGAAVQRGTN